MRTYEERKADLSKCLLELQKKCSDEYKKFNLAEMLDNWYIQDCYRIAEKIIEMGILKKNIFNNIVSYKWTPGLVINMALVEGILSNEKPKTEAVVEKKIIPEVIKESSDEKTDNYNEQQLLIVLKYLFSELNLEAKSYDLQNFLKLHDVKNFCVVNMMIMKCDILKRIGSAKNSKYIWNKGKNPDLKTVREILEAKRQYVNNRDLAKKEKKGKAKAHEPEVKTFHKKKASKEKPIKTKEKKPETKEEKQEVVLTTRKPDMPLNTKDYEQAITKEKIIEVKPEILESKSSKKVKSFSFRLFGILPLFSIVKKDYEK